MLDNKLKSICSVVLLALTTAFAMPSFAVNDVMLDLLKILRDKGSLTGQEYDLLVNAAKSDSGQMEGSSKNSKQESKQVIADTGNNSEWTGKIKLTGDIRTRYQGQWQDGATDRHRGRIRYRLGVIAKPVSGLEVGAGLASGGSDLRSTNQSFDTTFSTKGINLDYAYAQYNFNETLMAVAGKFKRSNYLWRTTDLMWDSDINPEGFSVNYTNDNDLGTTFVNTGIWVLEEIEDSEDDPYLIFGQLGQKFSIGEISATIAGTYYEFREINARDDFFTDDTITNTDFNFDSFSLSGELSMKDVLVKGSRIGVFADWVKNTDTDTSQNTGYAIGFKAENGAWDFKYIYADLEENAWPDIFPDSDRFDGLTGIDGHEFIFNYDLLKNVSLGLDYYIMENTADIDQKLLQLDVVVKF